MSRRVVAPCCLVAVSIVAVVSAGPSPAQPAGSTPGATVRTLPGAAAQPAHDFVAEVRANFTAENRRYARARQALAFASPAYVLLVAAVLLWSGAAARMRDIAMSMSRSRYAQTLVFVGLYSLAGYILSFPLAYFGGFALEHRFGLSNQSFAQWMGDELKGLAAQFALLGLVPVVYLGYLALRGSPRRWWVWLSAGTLPLMVLVVLVQPVLIDPLFNRFTPLQDRALKTEIVALADRAGIPGRNVYQVDKSRQTKKLSAYVNGFGASQRIVLWDTTLQGMSRDEILFVMGHEMGHYKLGHIWKGIAFFWLVFTAVYFVISRLLGALVARFGPRWRFHEVGDLASMPLLVALIALCIFLAGPLTNGYSRAVEHEADVFGLEVTQLNEPAAGAFIKLGAGNKSDPEPSPFIKFWLYTHPPLVERIRFALAYRPWERGEALRLHHPRP